MSTPKLHKKKGHDTFKICHAIIYISVVLIYGGFDYIIKNSQEIKPLFPLTNLIISYFQ